MTIRQILFVCTIVIQMVSAQEITATIGGRITDEQGTPLPFASIRVNGTHIGTVSDADGYYRLTINKGKNTIDYSYIGYEKHRLIVNIQRDMRQDILLKQSAVQLSEVLVQDENPAYPIIQEAINRKKKLKGLNSTFTAKTYSKETYGNDTSIILISEAYSTIHKKQDDPIKEIIVHRRQSSNIPSQVQLAVVGVLANFYDERVVERGYSFVSPIADDAFDYYDYKLVKTSKVGQRTTYEIEVLPGSRTTPLLSGTIMIEDSAHLVLRVDLEPNEIFHLPFYRVLNYRIIQQYGLYADRNWMPYDYHISGVLNINFMGLTNDSFYTTYKKSVVCYEYRFGDMNGDSISLLPALTVLPSRESGDIDPWKSLQILPLSEVEQQSYGKIDSMIKTHGNLSAELMMKIMHYDSLLKRIDVRYNRVEGLFLGGDFRENIFHWLRGQVAAGAALAERDLKYRLNIETGIGLTSYLWLGGEIYRTIGTGPLNYEAHQLSNGFSAFFNGEDYFDYHRRHGGRVYLRFEVPGTVDILTGLMDESQHSLPKITNVSLRSLGGFFELRKNPPVDDGRAVSLFAELSLQSKRSMLSLQPPDISVTAKYEYADPSIGSDFDFSTLYGSALLRLYPMGQSRLFDPYIALTIAGGRSIGTPPVQRIFGLVAPLSGFSFATSFRTVGIGEFTGDRFIFASIDYNVRNILFIKLGYPHFVYDILLGMSYGSIENHTSGLAKRVNPLPGGYREYRVGIGRVFEVLQFTFTYSDHLTGRYSFTTSTSL